jgi:hypothetical protein
MKRVPLQEAAPGMVLAKSVTNAAGQVVVAAGMVVDERVITHLERMGKAAVYIENAPGEGAGKSLEDVKRELALRFRKVEGDPQLSRIREAILRRAKSQTEASS